MAQFNEEFDLKIFKCRDVKTPTKAWDAAGWDFYIPNKLYLRDLIKNIEAFANENIIYKLNNFSVKVPIEVILKDTLKVSLFIEYDDHVDDKFRIVTSPKFYSEDCEIDEIILHPGSKILIPSGIHVNLPSNIFLNAANKSGVATKRGLLRGAELIDQDYEGEIHINLFNPTNNTVRIKPGEKIIQFVAYYQPIMKNAVEYNSVEELYKNKVSQRGAGGFGSSGTK